MLAKPHYSAVSVRKVSHRDFDDLFSILADYNTAVGVLKRDTVEVIRQLASGQGGNAWLARSSNAVVGCVTLRPLPSIQNACEIKRLFVTPSFRGRGVAKLLLAALERHVLKAHLQDIFLDSRLDLVQALNLYKSLGYLECEPYHTNGEAEIFMVKHVRSRDRRRTAEAPADVLCAPDRPRKELPSFRGRSL